MNHDSRLMDQYCVFQAEGAVWGVAASSVREITDMSSIVAVPEAPCQIVGICHLRTEFVPVLNLRGLLGEFNDLGDQRAGYLLILEGSEGPWALPIQRALSLSTLEVAMTEVGTAADARTSGIVGTATFRDQVIRVIEPSWLYRVAAESLDTHWALASGKQRESAGALSATALS